MTQLILPEKTQAMIQLVARRAPHGVLLMGSKGSGLSTVAQLLAQDLGELLEHITPSIKTSGAAPAINVETVRELYTRTRAKQSSKSVVIIEAADTMNQTAQNALLKLLEEPAANVHFILTANNADKLLPTIRSRLQSHSIGRLSDSESRLLLQRSGVDDTKRQSQILFAANGKAGLIYRLASDESLLETVVSRMKQVRAYIEGSTYRKLAIIMKLPDDRQEVVLFIDALMETLRFTLQANTEQSRVRQLEGLLDAREAVVANGNVRLQLMRAVL